MDAQDAEQTTDSLAERHGESKEDDATDLTTSDQPDRAARPFALRSAIITVVVSTVMALVINWPYQYSVASSSSLGSIDSTVDFGPLQDIPSIAGWPYHYRYAFAKNPSQSVVSIFSWQALLLNLGVASCACLIVAFYLYRRTLRIASGRLVGKRVTIADIMAITVLLALPLALWQRQVMLHNANQSLAKELRTAGASVSSEAWVPKVLANRLPQSLVSKLERIRAVRWESPSDLMLRKMVDRPGLTTLRLGGADYDLRLLDRLVANPLITDLRVSGRVIDAHTLQSLASHPRLHTLNLMRTNVSAPSLALLDELKGLKRLNLIHTDVQLADLTNANWTQTIQALSLPHPEPGKGDQVTIEGWPRLKHLRIDELDTLPNPKTLKVTLADLPELETLHLDIFQKIDLTLRNLPKLTEIGESDFEWELRITRGSTAPGGIWLTRLVAQDLPSLSGDVSFFTGDLSELQLTGIPKVESLGVIAQQRFPDDYRASGSGTTLSPDAAAALINGLANSEGPRMIDLAGVPLAGVDVAPLANNKQLKELILADSKTSIGQWKQLVGMTWLTYLDVRYCEIDSQGVQWVLDSFPDLEHFAFTPSRGSFRSTGEASLEIIDKPNLRVLDLGEVPMWIYPNVRIVNVPKLQLELKLEDVRQLELRGSPQLSGLAVWGPFPKQATLADLSGLRFFAVGGVEVTDHSIDAIAKCEALETLTLAYTSVSADALKSLDKIGSVTSLSVPGAPLDDSVIDAWPEFSKLDALDVSDTGITSAGLRKLLSSGRVSRIILDRTQVAKEDLAFLAKMPYLEQLSLVGVGIDSASLRAILSSCQIRKLNLSGSTLDPKVFDELLNGGSNLESLVLRDCQVDSTKLRELAKNNSKVVFDLTGSDATVQFESMLIARQRIADTSVMHMSNVMMQQMDETESPPGMIDVRQFAPRETAEPSNESEPQAKGAPGEREKKPDSGTNNE